MLGTVGTAGTMKRLGQKNTGTVGTAGHSLPTVVRDDLGVVTVYTDGREESEGPLEKKKEKR